MKLPGTRLLALARLILAPIAVERVLEPLVADWQREWLAASTPAHRLLARVRGTIAFATATVRCVLAAKRPWRLGTGSTLGVFALLGVLASEWQIRTRFDDLPLLVWLIPQMLAITLPFAAVPAAVQLAAANRDSPRARRHMLPLATGLTLVMLLLGGWIGPAASHAVRQHVTPAYARPVTRGAGELTLIELFVVEGPMNGIHASADSLDLERHVRVMFLVMPGVLTCLGWQLGRLSQSASCARLILFWSIGIVSALTSFRVVVRLQDSWSLPVGTAIWSPLALWCVAIAVLGISGGAKAPPLPMTEDRPV